MLCSQRIWVLALAPERGAAVALSKWSYKALELGSSRASNGLARYATH